MVIGQLAGCKNVVGEYLDRGVLLGDVGIEKCHTGQASWENISENVALESLGRGNDSETKKVLLRPTQNTQKLGLSI